MTDSKWEIKWNDKEMIEVSMEQLEAVMAEFGLTVETESKKELQKTGGTPRRDRRKGRSKNIISPHGVLTGTLRRSIHAANGDYNFAEDDVEPSESSPERGNQNITPKRESHRIVVAVGSGLKYAMKIHQGWGSFAGYHYITNGLDKSKAKLDSIVKRHQVK